MVATMYHNGLGTEKDLDWAFYYYLNASVDGAFASPLMLSKFYANGIGTEKDQAKADYWMNVYNDIQANPPPRNEIIFQGDAALISAGQKAVVVDTAELSVSGWDMVDSYSFIAGPDSYNGDYTVQSRSDIRFVIVSLSYQNLSANAVLYDEYITNMVLVFDAATVNKGITVLQPSGTGYTDPPMLIRSGRRSNAFISVPGAARRRRSGAFRSPSCCNLTATRFPSPCGNAGAVSIHRLPEKQARRVAVATEFAVCHGQFRRLDNRAGVCFRHHIAFLAAVLRGERGVRKVEDRSAAAGHQHVGVVGNRAVAFPRCRAP